MHDTSVLDKYYIQSFLFALNITETVQMYGTNSRMRFDKRYIDSIWILQFTKNEI